MASADISTETVSLDDQLSQIKTKIETYFQLLMNSLKERERQLLTELEEIVSSLRREKDQQKQSLSEIEYLLKQTQENIHSNVLKEAQIGIVKILKQQQREIESNLNSKRFSFNFDDTLLDKIKLFGNITVVNSTDSCLPVVKYKDKVRPVMCMGDVAGNSVGQFYNPWGVEVDNKTGNIYVADQSNNRVQMFDENLNYLSKIGQINSPLCITISKGKVFVSQGGPNCFSVFDMKGTLLKQIGTTGSGDGQFKNPRGIAINAFNDDIYVCDLSNKRIQIFSKDYSYKSQFGNPIINHPSDIQLTKDNIYVLSHHNPFLFIFNYNYQYLKNIISTSLSKYMKQPLAFKIDGAGNFVILDNGNNSIYIFDNNFTLLHQINEEISEPRGVTIDSNGRILVVGYNHRLLIF